ncbi:right-handed parallel beta-helix repeat-containing protein [Mucilaginibacter calamicampi]|uniref:Right-handed parallel beta-helix repeat-containing protein n=1 Tax=Mucilaginibacter calamicampi TaxID=1302352 RepID=A0ABW2YWR5_9SPHI
MIKGKKKLLAFGALIFVACYFITRPLIAEDKGLEFENLHDTTISNISIQNIKQPCLKFSNCSNITIKKCTLSNSTDVAIFLYKCRNVTIENCYITNVSTGVYALESQGIKIINNTVLNVNGPFPRGQMVQFDEVSGAGNRVLNNKCENIIGRSFAEDAISMYKSSGTPSDPILISGNLIKGGGPSITGGGIMLGDNGGEYIIATNNVLVNPGQYGMAISGGKHIQITNNKIYSKRQSFTNVGLYVWNQNPLACGDNTVSGNYVNWTNSKGAAHDEWNNGNCGVVTGWDTNVWRASIDSTLIENNFMLNKF